MKVRSIQLGDDDMPERLTVEMTTDEAAMLYTFVGRIAPAQVSQATGDVRWGNTLYDMAECVAGSFFNRFWDEGARAVAPDLSFRIDSPETR